MVNRKHRIGFVMFELLKYTTQILCLFQQSYCTSVTVSFGPFARLFLNPAVCMRTLFSEFASLCRHVEQAFWRMPLFTRWIRNYFWEHSCTADEKISKMDFDLEDFCLSLDLSHLAVSKVLSEEQAVTLALHAYYHCAGNYTCLLSHTACWPSIANILLNLCEHDVVPFDSRSRC